VQVASLRKIPKCGLQRRAALPANGALAPAQIPTVATKILPFGGRHTPCEQPPRCGSFARKQPNVPMKLMNPLAVKGRWNIVKGRLKQNVAILIGDELKFTEGKKEELIGRIQERAVTTPKKVPRTMV
jgi:uncharacterized protein YjbJ (UPF0337 family)